MRCVWHSRPTWLLIAVLLAAAVWILYSAVPERTPLKKIENDSYNVRIDERVTTQDEMFTRLELVRTGCSRYDVSSLRRVWYAGSNRQDLPRGCSTKQCPLLVDEQHLLMMCFIQKVASSSLKELYLAMDNKTVDNSNSTAFHLEANDQILRVSSVFYPEFKLRRFYKGLFVRHPFERLVSAYADKALPGRRKRAFFYNKYFLPAMKKFRGKVEPEAVITFKEFVEYLITTQPLYYDEHWMPYWSRCDVCRTTYDFLGKLESANQDSEFLLRQVGLLNHHLTISNRSNKDRTKKYFEDLSESQLVELYKTYLLDFKLFGYSAEEFFPKGTNISGIEESTQLFKLLY